MGAIPTEAMCLMSGLYYKIGRLGKVFYWSGDEWITSDKTSQEVEAFISKNNSSLPPR